MSLPVELLLQLQVSLLLPRAPVLALPRQLLLPISLSTQRLPIPAYLSQLSSSELVILGQILELPLVTLDLETQLVFLTLHLGHFSGIAVDL